MKLTWVTLSVAILLIGLTLGLSQRTLADNELREELAEAGIPPGLLKIAFGPLFTATDLSITKDIAETKARMKMNTDVKVQANEVRDLLLRVTGRITSYATSDLSLFSMFPEGDAGRLPYYLVGLKKHAPSDIPWFEFIKDTTNAPEFNDPTKLIERIAGRYESLSRAARAVSKDFLENLGEDNPKSGSASPDQEAPQYVPFTDPRLDRTKSIFRKLKQQNLSI